MDRRMLGEGQDWQALRHGFRWRGPERVSIAEACCDSWAKAEPERLALIELGEGGVCVRCAIFHTRDQACEGAAFTIQHALDERVDVGVADIAPRI